MSIDETANAIKSCKKAIAEVHVAGERLREAVENAESCLANIIKVDEHKDLFRIRRRIERITELRRSMELGALTVESARALDEAWKRLP